MIQSSQICKKCRRAGQKLFLKGEKCLTPKCPFIRRSYAPGQHGQSGSRITEYGKQLKEMQKAARIYGISNKQFHKYYKKSLTKKGMTDLELMRFLEMRLDSVVYRAGLAISRRQARIFLKDGHIALNGRKITRPSCQVKIGDIIEIKKSSQSKSIFIDIKESFKKARAPAWLELKPASFHAQVLRLPERTEIDTSVDEHIILEYFAR